METYNPDAFMIYVHNIIHVFTLYHNLTARVAQDRIKVKHRLCPLHKSKKTTKIAVDISRSFAVSFVISKQKEKCVIVFVKIAFCLKFPR